MHVDFGGEHANGMRQKFGEESGERALHAAVTNLLLGLLPAFVFLTSTLVHDVCAGWGVRSGGCALKKAVDCVRSPDGLGGGETSESV